MAWTGSKIFQAYLGDSLEDTAQFDLGATGVDIINVALYNNTITPDVNATSANTAYNVGQWVTAGEVFEAGQWAAGGVALTSPDISMGTAGVVFFDANDTASGSAADLTNATGALVYDNDLTTPVAKQGVCFNWFGGPNSVVNGTMTIQWHVNGLFRVTL